MIDPHDDSPQDDQEPSGTVHQGQWPPPIKVDDDSVADDHAIRDEVGSGGESPSTAEPSPDDVRTHEGPIGERPGDRGQSLADGSAVESIATPEPSEFKTSEFELDRSDRANTLTIEIPAEFAGTREADPTNSESLPSHVGKFRVIRELGRGAFGVVYLAHDDDIDRDVAIKLSLNQDANYQDRLRVEASKVALVEGPHIVKVHHVDRTDFGAVYIVQNYVNGCTLGQLQRSGAKITPGQALILIYQLAIGLKEAHAKEILHRDLKPENILLDVKGVPWIVDFGLAISENEQVGRRRELAGTPPYMSPEQIQGRVDFMDARSDIWSLGVIMYELLTGKLPFRGRTKEDYVQQICHRDPRPIHQFADTLTEDMNDVFRKCCAKQPQDRFATVDELSLALRGLIERHATKEDFEQPLGFDAGLLDNRNFRIQTPESLRDFDQTRWTREDEPDHTRDERPLVSQPTIREVAGGTIGRVASGLTVATVAVVLGLFVRDRLGNDFVRSVPTVDPSTEMDAAELAIDTDPEVAPEPPSDDQVSQADSESVLPIDPPPPSDPELIEYDGSSPRLVSLQGTAHHRSIQNAIDLAAPGEVIQIAAGIYHESLKVTKAIGLTAAGDRRPEIQGDGRALLSVECRDGVVTVDDLNFTARESYEDASGNRQPFTFNTINVKFGSLEVSDARISKLGFGSDDSLNCINTSSGASLVVDGCEFTESAGFAISVVDAQAATIRDCDFDCLAIQVLGGGSIESCRFAGEAGVNVQRSRDFDVKISNCVFENIPSWGLGVTAGGRVMGHGNRFNGCAKGVYVGAQDDYANLVGDAGSYTGHGDTFNQCKMAVSVAGGSVELKEDCVIRGGDHGIGVTLGDATVSNSKISGCAVHGIETIQEAGDIHVANTVISDCGSRGLLIEACRSLDINRVGAIRTGAVGMEVRSGNVTIKDFTARDVGTGLSLINDFETDRCDGLRFERCDYGLFVDGSSSRQLRLSIVGCHFNACPKLAIYARNDVEIEVRDSEFIEIKKKFMAAPPAVVVEVDDQP